MLAKQALYCLSHSSSLFFSGYFGDRVSRTTCLGWPQTVILPISASQVVRITGVSHGLVVPSVDYNQDLMELGLLEVIGSIPETRCATTYPNLGVRTIHIYCLRVYPAQDLGLAFWVVCLVSHKAAVGVLPGFIHFVAQPCLPCSPHSWQNLVPSHFFFFAVN
jgi:hypothetical protein